MTVYNITPRGAVRLTRQDKFKPSLAARRYFKYGKDIRAAGVTLPDMPHIIFRMPMPDSWPKKKRDAMRGQPHRSKPDCDNLLKGLQDSIYFRRDDAHVWSAWIEKRWSDEGSIEINALGGVWAFDPAIQDFAMPLPPRSTLTGNPFDEMPKATAAAKNKVQKQIDHYIKKGLKVKL